jgi:hypothetical protein
MQNWMCTANGRENVEWKQWSQHAKWQCEDEHEDDSGITLQNDNVMRSAQWKHQPSVQNEDGGPIAENGDGRPLWSFFHVLCSMLLDDETFFSKLCVDMYATTFIETPI